MVANLFNHLVTALDIIPDSTSVDICTNHPSTCVLTGKVRIISKRPFVYKSLTLSAKGTSCVFHRQGPKSMKEKQVFLDVTKDIVHERSYQRSRRDSLSPLSSPIHGPLEIPNDLEPTNVTLSSAPRDSSSSSNSSSNNNSSGGSSGPISHQSQSPLSVEQEQQSPVDRTAFQTDVMPASVQNQVEEGVNDIDFRIEFPSHLKLSSQQPHPGIPGANSDLCSLPSGPIKTTAGRSSVTYTLNATLIISRKYILVNNQMSVSVPFQVQTWQDMIDWNQSEDSSYHGRRRNKIEFQFQVPKQLDLHRLHDLHFGFSAKWRTLQDHLKIKEVQYYIIEEEQQEFAARTTPVVNTTIISTSATHDCSDYSTPTNRWGHLSSAARLQIPQPNTVLETTSTPWPHSLTISHKLRVLIRFDQTLTKERQLQLSFPIRIHPTLSANGSPAHPELFLGSYSWNRRRLGRSLYGIDSRSGRGDDENIDEEDYPLPIYGNREDSLLLMVGQEVQEAGLHVDALGVSMGINILDQGLLRSPSEASVSLISSAPNSPISIGSDSSSFSFVNVVAQEEQHTRNPSHRSASLTPASPMNPFNLLSGPRRHSSIEHISSLLYPPPYILPTLSEERPETTAFVASEESLNTSPVENASSGQREDDAFEPNVDPISEAQRGGDEGESMRETGEARFSGAPIPFGLPTPPYEA
ncbi:hypothetical protein BGX26_012027 [Mortierella sp. AD094]|nr:hypothetical protein BGX26_012027 [Mortierella sp. AD094]